MIFMPLNTLLENISNRNLFIDTIDLSMHTFIINN